MLGYKNNKLGEVSVENKVKISCAFAQVITHYAMKTYGGAEV
jgi:hypothetical protein